MFSPYLYNRTVGGCLILILQFSSTVVSSLFSYYPLPYIFLVIFLYKLCFDYGCHMLQYHQPYFCILIVPSMFDKLMEFSVPIQRQCICIILKPISNACSISLAFQLTNPNFPETHHSPPIESPRIMWSSIVSLEGPMCRCVY